MNLKTAEEIRLMAEGGRRLARVLKALSAAVRPGVRTKDLDTMAFELIKAERGAPAFLGYRPAGAKRAYPATLCASINDVVVHGLPSDHELQEGDLAGLDLGLVYEGFCADAAVTVPVGKISTEAQKLLKVTSEALAAAVRQARPGGTLGDIGAAVHRIVTQAGFSVVESLTGHGIGRALHEDPHVYNFGRPGAGEKLKAGMVIAIEPMVAAGSGKVRQLKDGSFATADGSRAAHFEHTVAVTKEGPVVLTYMV